MSGPPLAKVYMSRLSWIHGSLVVLGKRVSLVRQAVNNDASVWDATKSVLDVKNKKRDILHSLEVISQNDPCQSVLRLDGDALFGTLELAIGITS